MVTHVHQPRSCLVNVLYSCICHIVVPHLLYISLLYTQVLVVLVKSCALPRAFLLCVFSSYWSSVKMANSSLTFVSVAPPHSGVPATSTSTIPMPCSDHGSFTFSRHCDNFSNGSSIFHCDGHYATVYHILKSGAASESR